MTFLSDPAIETLGWLRETGAGASVRETRPLLGNEIPMSDREKLVDFEDALLEISEAKGAFKIDPFEHAKSCIHDMHEIAANVLTKWGIHPRRMSVE